MAGLTNTPRALCGSAGACAQGFHPQQCKENSTACTLCSPRVQSLPVWDQPPLAGVSCLAFCAGSSSIFSSALPSTALCTGEDPRGREKEVVPTVTQFRNHSEAHSIHEVFMALKAFQGDAKYLLSCRRIQIGTLARPLTSSDGL